MPHEPSAAETYAARAKDIARLLDVLISDLASHAHAAKADPTNWGKAGDLGKVRSDLIALVAFMTNDDPEKVEAILADLADAHREDPPSADAGC